MRYPKYVYIFLPVMLLMTSCASILPVEEPVLPPPVLRTYAATNYKVAYVVREDIQNIRELSASYVPAVQESLEFDIGNINVRSVLVSLGDYVKKGDILIELDHAQIDQDLLNAERDLARTELALTHMSEQSAIEQKKAELTGSGMDEVNKRRDELLNKRQQTQIRIEELMKQRDRRIMRAGIDGNITYLRDVKLWDLSEEKGKYAIISDKSLSVFIVTGENAKVLKIGDELPMRIGKEEFVARVISPDEINAQNDFSKDTAYLKLLDDTVEVNEKAYASVSMLMDERKGVLTVPTKAVRKADNKRFVYMLKDDVRTYQVVETGLENGEATEIISGLSEGDMVIVE